MLGYFGGAIAWCVALGPPGWIIGAIGGAFVGNNLDPEKRG